MPEPTFHGRTFRYALPNGWSFLMAFTADGTGLRMEGLTGEHAGQSLDLEINAVRIAPGIHFLNWIKPDGGAVSQVHDYNTGTVHAFWAFEEAGGHRGVTTTGTLTRVDGATD